MATGYNVKEALLPEMDKITVKHQRGEEYLSKAKRYDDCFAMCYDPEAQECRDCNIKTVYNGVELPFKELCKLFMNKRLFDGKEATGSVDKPSGKTGQDAGQSITADTNKGGTQMADQKQDAAGAPAAEKTLEEQKKDLQKLVNSSRLAMKENEQRGKPDKVEVYKKRMEESKVQLEAIKAKIKAEKDAAKAKEKAAPAAAPAAAAAPAK